MENKKQSSIIKDSVILCIITLAAGLLLGVVYEMTKGPIEQRKLIAKQETYQSAYLEASSFGFDEALTASLESCQETWNNGGSEFGKVTFNEVLLAKDTSGNTIGYMISTTSREGYAGDIVIALGISLDGTVKGIQILEMSETPGLGAKASDESFLSQYMGKRVDAFTVVKGAASENEIDALSSATITSKAVTDAVNAGLFFINNYGGGK